MKGWISGLFIFAFVYCKSQVFWTENFGSGACSTGALASAYSGTNGAWAITSTGVNNSSANTWFVSATERGMGAGVCGSGCGGTNNKTLHLGSTGSFLTDLGASYNATGNGNITDKRADSPTINCSGKTGITLAFNYMEFGEGTNDNGTVWYFNGSTWAQLVDVPKTSCCGPATCNGSLQGLWTAYSISLPVSANNNASVKIGFRWVNNGNGVGTDPSFAIDDITLSVPVVLPIEIADFYYEKDKGGGTWLYWKTASEKNSDYFEVQRSFDGRAYAILGTVKAAGLSYSQKTYEFFDADVLNTTVYYRLKLVDRDGFFQYQDPIVVQNGMKEYSSAGFYIHADELFIENIYLEQNQTEQVMIYNSEGKIVFSQPVKDLNVSEREVKISLSDLPTGVYVCMLRSGKAQKTFKFLLSR